MPEASYNTWGDWLFTTLDFSNFSPATLDDQLKNSSFSTMPRGCLIEGFIPLIGYNGIAPTEEQTREAIAHILHAREKGKEIKTRFHSWAAIISYASNELDFQGIQSYLEKETQTSLQDLRNNSIAGIDTLLDKAPLSENTLKDESLKQIHGWLQAQGSIECSRILHYLQTGRTDQPITEKEKQKIAKKLYTAFTDHCYFAAPDKAMLEANANQKEAYKPPYQQETITLGQHVAKVLAERDTSLAKLRKTGEKIAIPLETTWVTKSPPPTHAHALARS